MKKFTFFRIFALIALILFAFSCKKNELIISSDLLSDNDTNEILKLNSATWVPPDDHSKWWIFKINYSIGHTPSACGGKCVMILGQFGHIDCRGFGNVCNHTAKGRVVEGNGTIKLVLDESDDLGDELEFLFPDRALYITNPQNNTDFWINIPEQLLIRDNSGIPFEMLDIWFSEEPELENK